MKKKDFEFDRERWFYRQMYKTLAKYDDDEVIDQMMKTKAHRDQLAYTPRFQIIVSDDGKYKEVWAMSPKFKEDEDGKNS